MKRHKSRALSSAQRADEIFRQRAERLQSECGWCGESIGEEQPVFAIGGKARPEVDLSLVQGKVVEIALLSPAKKVLAGVAAFDSDAKKAGNDLVFMVCSEECGRQLKSAVASELARRP